VLFALAGIALGVSRHREYLLVLMALGAAVVAVITQTSVSNAVASRWIRRDEIPGSGVAAVVVLSAAVNPNGTISSEALDHLITGLELTRGKNSPMLVTTTVLQTFPTAAISSVPDQLRIVALFDGRTRWIRTHPGTSTRDEALSVADSLLPKGLSHIVVVSSPMHTRRACSAFEAVGFFVTCVPARSRSPGGSAPGPWPRDRLTVFGDWVYEVAATAKYQMKGWLGPRQPGRSTSP
jgi:uncharacterized SAM-binding protein YcdF (DUF218 family)